MHGVRSSLRSVSPGREKIGPHNLQPRHRHLEAYALIAVAGAFEQANYAGRVVARAGDILIQPTLDCHANRLMTQSAEILRLPWNHVDTFGGLYRLSDLDRVVRVAERDPEEARRIVVDQLSRTDALPSPTNEWPDLLARDLASDRVSTLAQWADDHALEPETVSRGFARLYDVAPARFRFELKVRSAWLKLMAGKTRLAVIAAESGFSDQAHMTRSISALTGASPKTWRARH